MPSKNPFRHVAPSNEVGTMVQPPSPPLPPLPPQYPPNPSPSQSAIPTSSDRSASSLTVLENLDDELPPPYTPTPNTSIGEETVSLGPRRPFQQPPSIPPPSSHPSVHSRPYSNPSPPSSQPIPPLLSISNSNRSSSSSQPIPPLLSVPGLSNSRPAPWQNQNQYRQRQNGGGGLLGTLFDAIQEISDAVSSTQDEQTRGLHRANAGAYATPYSNTGTAYAPPAGPPAPMHSPLPHRPASTPPSSLPAVPDDGTPTRMPVPGHPLLRNGQLLVYPKDYSCDKCKNTGYKNYDPSHPCRKCWEKYGKPYTGALAYTPWSPSGNDPRMQRALPKFVPPHLAGIGRSSSSAAYASPSSRAFPPPPQHPQHSRSISQPHSVPTPPVQGLSYYVLNPLCSYDGVPPVPDAIAVSPGDERLGGWLCLRCDGQGIRLVGLLDLDTCDRCGGTGRVWR